jgi:tyrosyl-tRNA synthetase
MSRSAAEQLEILRRGCEQITPEADLAKRLEESLASRRPLRVKYGIDPTGIDVHLGHTVPLRKLRQFQELGHQAVLIIGNYTALVGDPSGRDQTRAQLTPEQVEANAQDYLRQVAKVIDLSQAEVRYNGEWFSTFSFLDTMALTSKITVQRMLERDDFTKRFRAEPSIPISLHECLYPLMQGHDSVVIHADIELGGSEQLFNLMMGRRLQELDGQRPQICMTLPILRGLDGERRMGKSLGNYVGVGMPAQEQFDRIMSIPDALLAEWYELLTDIRTFPDNPFEAKKQLGAAIVAGYHGAEAGQQARVGWENRFSRKQDPDEIPEVLLTEATLTLPQLVKALNLAPSGNEARRLVESGAVNVGPDRTQITDPKATIELTDGLIVRVGSRKIARVKRG